LVVLGLVEVLVVLGLVEEFRLGCAWVELRSLSRVVPGELRSLGWGGARGELRSLGWGIAGVS